MCMRQRHSPRCRVVHINALLVSQEWMLISTVFDLENQALEWKEVETEAFYFKAVLTDFAFKWGLFCTKQ